MRFKDFLLEGDVVKGNFGKGSPVDGLEIPKGYKSFYTKGVGKKDATQIIGVKADGTEKVLSTTTTSELAKELVKYYNTGKSEKLQPVTMAQAFGSSGYNIINDLGFKFKEKPDYFSEVRSNGGIGEPALRKIKNEFKKNNLGLKEYDSEEIFGKYVNNDDRLDAPTASVKWKPEEEIFIIKFSETGNKYIVDKSGATKYIRFWLAI